VARQVRPAPDRYRNAIGKYRIERRAACASCGLCVKLCPHGVHQKTLNGMIESVRLSMHKAKRDREVDPSASG